MRKILFLLLIIPTVLFGQNSSVTFLDGETMKRLPFINECMAAWGPQERITTFKNGGLNYCNCFLDKLAERYTYSEFMFDYYTARGSTESYEEAAYQLFKNPKILGATEECIEDPTTMNTDVHMEISSKEMLELHILQCKEGLKESMSVSEYNELMKYVYIDEFCGCYMKRMTKEFTVKEMDNLEQRDNLRKVEHIQEDCMYSNLRD